MQLFFHLKICDGCRNYQHHSEKIHKALQTYLRKQETPVQNVNVPEDLKKEILDEWERHKKQ
jgi:Txe/YoeB family toxin of Txe-Axe toxin-antitoxin module